MQQTGKGRSSAYFAAPWLSRFRPALDVRADCWHRFICCGCCKLALALCESTVWWSDDPVDSDLCPVRVLKRESLNRKNCISYGKQCCLQLFRI